MLSQKKVTTNILKMVHGVMKTFKCETWDYRCYQKGDLNRHVEFVHEVKKPFFETLNTPHF